MSLPFYRGPEGLAEGTAGSETAIALEPLVSRARAAQRIWSLLPLHDRLDVMLQFQARLLASAPALAQLVHDHTGVDATEALMTEVLAAAELLEGWTMGVEAWLAPDTLEFDPMVFAGKTGRVLRAPRGVVAVLTPSYCPVLIPVRHLVPHLLAGNAVLIQPREPATAPTAAVLGMLDKLVPEGLVAVVPGDAQVSAPLAGSGVDAVSFTGSRDEARMIAGVCADRLVPCNLELAQRHISLVLADARLNRAARGVVWDTFSNGLRSSVAHAYVERSAADEWVRQVKEHMRALARVRLVVPGGTGALREFVRSCLQHGAELVAGDEIDSDRLAAPLVLRWDGQAPLKLRQEQCWPILIISPVPGVQAAIDQANAHGPDTTVSLWTRPSRGEQLALGLGASAVTVNNHVLAAAIPSAIGTPAATAMATAIACPGSTDPYARTVLRIVDRSRHGELWWYPHTRTLRRLVLAVARLRGGPGLIARLVALVATAMLLVRRRWELRCKELAR